MPVWTYVYVSAHGGGDMELPRLVDGRLKIRHLVLVDALTTQGSVVGAAAALHMTQPVATRSLHEVERLLGVTLYERGPRGITPTVFGAAFTEHARSVLAQLHQASRHIVELADAGRGVVIVGVHLAGSNVLLPQAILRLKTHHPLLTVVVREGYPDTLLAELEAGRIDMIVGRLTSASTEVFFRKPLYDESVRVFVRREHPVAQQAEISLAELVEHPWILPSTETVLRREVEELLARHGLRLPENRVEATSYLTVRQLLLESDRIAVLPSLIGGEEPRLVTVPVSLDLISHSVGITTAAHRTLQPSATALIANLQLVAQGL